MATHAQRRNLGTRSADLVDQVHVSGALSGACTEKGPREWKSGVGSGNPVSEVSFIILARKDLPTPDYVKR